MDACAQGVPRVVLHHDVGPTRRGGADVKNVDDVRMAGQLAHCALLAQKSFDVVWIEIGGEHLDRNRALQSTLHAAVNRAETADSDFLGIFEPCRGQFRSDRRRQITCCRLFALGHRRPWPRYCILATAQPYRYPLIRFLEHSARHRDINALTCGCDSCSGRSTARTAHRRVRGPRR